MVGRGRQMTQLRAVVNVVLDLDGTLTDPKEGILACVKYALRAVGSEIPADGELEGFIGPPLQDSFTTLLGPNDQSRLNDAIALYRERFLSKGMFENAVYPGIRDVLIGLRELGVSLHVATSKPLVFAERIVEHFDLRGFFSSVHGSELDGARSNKSELIAYLLKVESLPAPATIMVGDRAHDVVGAKANGVLAIGALWGYGSREELVSAGAELLCEQPSMLVETVSFNIPLNRDAPRRAPTCLLR